MRAVWIKYFPILGNCCQRQPQRTLPDWLLGGHGIEKPSHKLLALAKLDSNTWASEVNTSGARNHR
jgi:hypothetical protein